MTVKAKEYPGRDVYERLAAPFDTEFHDNRGGVSIVYITGAQVRQRLNETLGPFGWTFNVVQHGINQEADEAWVLGELIVFSYGLDEPLLVLSTDREPRVVLVKRMQFGSQKLKRSRKDKTILDVGFDFKGAATDALKKCAADLGVGLYLSFREGGTPTNYEDQQSYAEAGPVCDECGEDVRGVRFNDEERTEWSAQQVAARALQETALTQRPRVLCMKHLREVMTANGRT